MKRGVFHRFLGAAAITVAGFGIAPEALQAFPERPVTVIVAWPAGGGHDTVTRLVTEFLEQELHGSVVVNNVPGAAGATGVRQVEVAAPDGYTIGVLGLHATAQSYMNENATALENLEPLAVINVEPAALAVRADTGIESFEEFLEFARVNPGRMVNGNDSPGGFSYLNAAFIENSFDIELTKVPYQGYAPTVAAIVSGEVMSATLPVPMLADLHDAGTVRILGVAARERHFRVPEVPTFVEMGHDYVVTDYVMFYGPAGIPEDRRGILEEALLAAMNQPAFHERGREMGLMLQPAGAEEAAALMASMDDLIYPVMESAGLVTVRAR